MAWVTKVPRYTPHASQFEFAPGVKAPSGCCTLMALACCDIVSKGIRAYVLDPHAAHPEPDSVENVQAVMHRIYTQARQHTLCDVDGAADQYDMLKMAAIIGLPVKEVLYYAPEHPFSVVQDFLRRNVAHSPTPFPCLIQVSNGQALMDNETGGRDETGLQCHAFALYGTQTDDQDATKGGYVGCDGDQADANGQTVCYNLATLKSANVISMIAFDYVR